jgi:1-aminocyclopropane-1-carboxylate deaminase/D-cysteine desulfhydrase-like pyridoxal-dependent ACC family enzyme
MDLSRFPRRRYTDFATPIEPLPRFSAALAATCPGGKGPEVWVKRDDMLGLFPGGNKTRKLEFLVADALAQGADTLITCGAPQSNHCRITLAAAAREGLQCRFVIEERVPGSYDPQASGNNFMFRLMGVEAVTVVPGGSNMAQAMAAMAAELAAAGRKGYIIPGGGSNAIGGLGYVACAQEMQQQWFEQGLHFDRVVVGSGRTAGCWPGSSATGSTCRSLASVSAAIRPTRRRWCTRRRRRSPICWASTCRCRASRWCAWAATGSPSIRCPIAGWSRRCRCWRAPKACCSIRSTPARSWPA